MQYFSILGSSVMDPSGYEVREMITENLLKAQLDI